MHNKSHKSYNVALKEQLWSIATIAIQVKQDTEKVAINTTNNIKSFIEMNETQMLSFCLSHTCFRLIPKMTQIVYSSWQILLQLSVEYCTQFVYKRFLLSFLWSAIHWFCLKKYSIIFSHIMPLLIWFFDCVPLGFF